MKRKDFLKSILLLPLFSFVNPFKKKDKEVSTTEIPHHYKYDVVLTGGLTCYPDEYIDSDTGEVWRLTDKFCEIRKSPFYGRKYRLLYSKPIRFKRNRFKSFR